MENLKCNQVLTVARSSFPCSATRTFKMDNYQKMRCEVNRQSAILRRLEIKRDQLRNMLKEAELNVIKQDGVVKYLQQKIEAQVQGPTRNPNKNQDASAASSAKSLTVEEIPDDELGKLMAELDGPVSS